MAFEIIKLRFAKNLEAQVTRNLEGNIHLAFSVAIDLNHSLERISRRVVDVINPSCRCEVEI